jgi:hypothetical protein
LKGRAQVKRRQGGSPPATQIRVLPPVKRPMSEEQQREALEALRQLLLEHLGRKAQRRSVSQVRSSVEPLPPDQEEAS